MSSMAKPSSKFEGVVRLLPMPSLSPLMTSGKLLKWHAAEGAMISAYSLIADVQPDQLTAVLDERPIMEIELQEDMYIAKIFCAEGKEIKSGTPIAILCEIEEDIEHAKALLVKSCFAYEKVSLNDNAVSNCSNFSCSRLT